MKRSSRLRRAACACAVITAVVLGVCSPAAAASPATAGAYCVMDAQTGEVICQKNAYARMEMASTTKVMTALVALENAPLSLTVRITRAEAGTEGSSMYLRAGDVYTLEDLLLGMMLVSGNDAALAVARTVAGSEASFVRLMNEKAQALGMEQTQFTNSTGLHDDKQYTTVKDLSILLRYALQNETFRTVFTCIRYVVPATNCLPDGFTMQSSLFGLLEQLDCPGGVILGGKTGYTEKAGLCLATLANINGAEYLLVTARADGNHTTEPYHVLDALQVYRQLGAQF